MFRLPKRPLFYVVTLLLVFLVALTWFLTRAVTSPELQEAVEEKRALQGGLKTLAPPPPQPVEIPVVAPIDPHLVELAAPLNAPGGAVEEDLGILGEVMRQFQKMQGGNPTGLNEDITAALTGGNHDKALAFPADHPAIVDGQLVDRWGTPLWFHPVSASQMEIRSAGPDRELFTSDDYVLGDSGVSDQGNLLPE